MNKKNPHDFYTMIAGGTASVVWREGRMAYVNIDFVGHKVKVDRNGVFRVNGVWYRL